MRFNRRRELLWRCNYSDCIYVVVLLNSSGMIEPLQELLRLKDLGLKISALRYGAHCVMIYKKYSSLKQVEADGVHF